MGRRSDERVAALAAELQRLVAASPVTYATVDLTLPQLRAIMLLHRGAAFPVGAIGRSLQMSLGSASARRSPSMARRITSWELRRASWPRARQLAQPHWITDSNAHRRLCPGSASSDHVLGPAIMPALPLERFMEQQVGRALEEPGDDRDLCHLDRRRSQATMTGR